MTSRISSTPLTNKMEKLKAAMYRSKCRWIEGRKTKYFSRKKTNYMYTKKVSMELEDENGGMATDETPPKYDAGTGSRTRATLVGAECSHHCAIPAPHN